MEDDLHAESENAACSVGNQLKGGAQQFAGTGLKIATYTAGMLGPFILISEREG